MSRKISLFVGIVLMIAGSLLTGSVSATTINVPNASFENGCSRERHYHQTPRWLVGHTAGRMSGLAP